MNSGHQPAGRGAQLGVSHTSPGGPGVAGSGTLPHTVFFSALVANNGDGPGWLADDHAIMIIVLAGDDPGEYFDIGDRFALWLGSDIARGVVTRRLFI